MDSKIKEIVDFANNNCGSIPADLLKFKSGIQGKDVKEKILELVGYLSFFSELYDKAKYKSSMRKRRMEIIRAHALMAITKDEKLSKLAVPIKEQYVEIYRFELDGKEVNYNDVSREYDAYIYAMDRFSSMFEDIKIAIMACQSVLSFDKEEMKSISI
jgi:hypothetical protein